MRVLLTGATGFVGRPVLHALLSGGHDVLAVSRSAQPQKAGIEWLVGDLLQSGEATRIGRVARADIVLHLAWVTEHGRYWEDPSNATWTQATLEIAIAAAESGASRFCGVGTCFEYDWPSDADCDEASTPTVDHTPYDAAKNSCRKRLEEFTRQAKLSFSWARMFHLYGPHEHPERLVSSIARSLVSGKTARCTSGTAVRDYIDVRDAGIALAALAASNVEGPVNIATGRGVRVADIAMTLGRLAGEPDLIQLGALPDRVTEPPRITARVERLSREVGFAPTRSLEDGLKDALEFWRRSR